MTISEELRDIADMTNWEVLIREAADLIEEQQKRIAELENWHNIDNKQVTYLLEERSTAQTQIKVLRECIELYEQALSASWPEGAMGDAYEYWNQARIALAKTEGGADVTKN